MTGLGPIRQIGFVTRDLQQCLRFMVDHVGIGPWFVAERVCYPDCSYRGNAIGVELSIALGNCGPMQYEIIEQVGGNESIYTEWLKQFPDGNLAQHYASWVTDYAETRRTAAALGYQIIQEGRAANGLFVYFRHPDNPTFIHEVVELTQPRRSIFEQIADAAHDWDGRDPVRKCWPRPID